MAMEDLAAASSSVDAFAASSSSVAAAADPAHGWQKVTYPKRHRKPAAAAPHASDLASGGNKGSVFEGLDKRSQERHRAIQAARDAADADGVFAAVTSPYSDDDEDSDDAAAAAPPQGEVKKPKKPKVKKPRVTVPDAAVLIDPDSLAAHLVEITASYENQQDIQLMRFADYFGRAFANVGASSFPWAKMFKESSVNKMANGVHVTHITHVSASEEESDRKYHQKALEQNMVAKKYRDKLDEGGYRIIPLLYIPEPVCKTASDWINQRSPDALGEFVLWCIDSIMTELSGQSVGAKGSKKVVQHTPKAQVAIFIVLALTLRRKSEVLINIFPKIMGNSKYLGQEKLPIITWVIAQASEGDLVSGMFCWTHYLFPAIYAKSSVNPQSRDLVLQLLERIKSAPKAEKILVNGAVRKGERLVPPSTFDLFMRGAFPSPNARVKATERFEAAYPIMKELTLGGPPGSKTVRQAAQHLLPFCVKAMQENNAGLTKESADVFIWCLTQNAECYKQWEKLHPENIKASLAVLSKITADWKMISPKLSSEALKATLKNLRAENEAALEEETDSGKKASIKEADKYCKVILGRLSRGATCLKSSLVVIALTAAAAFVVSPNLELPSDLEKLQAMVSSHLSF